MRALKFGSIEPLVKSDQHGLVWSVNEILDFKNHINDVKFIKIVAFKKIPLYKNISVTFHDSKKSLISFTDQINPYGS